MIHLIAYSVGPTIHQGPALWPWLLLIAGVAVGYVKVKHFTPDRAKRHTQPTSGAGATDPTAIHQLIAAAYPPPSPLTNFLGMETVTAANPTTGLTIEEAGPELTRIVAGSQKMAEARGWAPKGAPYHGALRHTEGGL